MSYVVWVKDKGYVMWIHQDLISYVDRSYFAMKMPSHVAQILAEKLNGEVYRYVRGNHVY